jgi:hypothetical protein
MGIMRSKRVISAALILGTASIALTACDPPMPPEVAAQLAEQTYTCVAGDASISAPGAMTDLFFGWADSLTYACVDPEPTMTMSLVEDPLTAGAEVSDYAPLCTAVATVPLAVEAGVLVYYQSEVGSLNLSPKSIQKILNGSITNWNQLNADNPGYEMPDFPLTVVPTADTQALKSLTNYLSINKLSVTSPVVTATDHPVIDQYAMLEDGQVAIVPNSYAVLLGLYPAAIYLGTDKETQEPILATPDVAGIQSASTQWVTSQDAKGITVSLDPKKTPLAPEGSDFAPAPYQAIYPVNYNMCGTDSLLTRAAGRFLLRLDNQGALGASNYAPLPEAVRITALLAISKGLPSPKPIPTE